MEAQDLIKEVSKELDKKFGKTKENWTREQWNEMAQKIKKMVAQVEPLK